MRDLALVFAAAFLRAVAVGALSVFFGLYLASLHFDTARIGIAIGVGLGGMAAGTLIVGALSERAGRRRCIVAASLVMIVGAAGLAATEEYALLLAAAFAGMVNGMGRDRGPAQAIDLAILAQVVSAGKRTATFARYSLAVDIGTAVGSLLAGLPATFSSEATRPDAYRFALAGYGALLMLSLALYLFASRSVEPATPPAKAVLSPAARRLVFGFAALSAVDSLGGGFITRALLSYWFIERFGIDAEWAARIFAAAALLNAVAYLVAARLAKEIGLVNTMVFTHLPSNVLLILVPLAPTFGAAVVLFLAREFLSPMDIPTRHSYLAAIVAENERAAAIAVTNTVRNAAWTAGPVLAGWAMSMSMAAPLFLAGGTKIIYDVVLWLAFRRLKPPEER